MKQDLLWKAFSIFLFFSFLFLSLDVVAQLTVPPSGATVGSSNTAERRLIILQSRKSQRGGSLSGRALPPADYYDAQIDQCQVRIYTQPEKAQLRIEITAMSNLSTSIRLQIFSLNGSLVSQLNKLELVTDLDLSGYPFGMYILHLSSGDQNISWKIMMK